MHSGSKRFGQGRTEEAPAVSRLVRTGRLKLYGAALVALVSLSGCKTLLHSDEAIEARMQAASQGQSRDARRAVDDRDDEQAARLAAIEDAAIEDEALRERKAQDAIEAEKLRALEQARQAELARKAEDARRAEEARQARASALAREAAAINQSGNGLKGRKLLRASVNHAFADMRVNEGFWNGPSRLELPGVLAGKAGPEVLQRAINRMAFEVALDMEPFLREAAHELPMKFGREKFKGQMPVSDFMHRTLGSATFNTLEARFYTALGASRDPALAPILKGLDRTARKSLAVEMARATDDAIWAEVKRSEVMLGRGGVVQAAN